MNALPDRTPLVALSPSRAAVSPEALAECVRVLDPGSRALLDLSLRRRLPFEAMAGVLHTDPFDLARRRARAVARIAAELDLEGAGVVATVKAALARLPDEAWGVAVGGKPSPADAQVAVPDPVQAEPMADAARALMVKLREHRERVREASVAAAAASEQPTIEMEIVVAEPEPPSEPEPWTPTRPSPVAATDMAAAFAGHPAFAVETEHDTAASALPPLAVALARAAASERVAASSSRPAESAASSSRPAEPAASSPRPAEPAASSPPPAKPDPATTIPQPAPPPSVPPALGGGSRRRLARGGLLIGLLLAIVRLLLGRR